MVAGLRDIHNSMHSVYEFDQNLGADAIKCAWVHPVGEPATMRGGREVSTLYSRRQLLVNATIAASHVGS